MDGQIMPRAEKPRMRPVAPEHRLAELGFRWMCYDGTGAGFGETQAEAYSRFKNPVSIIPTPLILRTRSG